MSKLVCGVLVSLMLVVGWQANIQEAAAQDEELDTVRMTILPFVSHAPFYIADAEGYFEEEGINAEITVVRDSDLTIVALTQGEADVGGQVLNPGYLNSVARGSGVRIVADKGTVSPEDECSYINFVVANEVLESGEVETISDLSGMTIYADTTSSMGYLFDITLRAHGMSIDDITVENLSAPVAFEAMGSGAIQGMLTGDPWSSRLEEAGIGTRTFDIDDALEDEFSFSYVVFSEAFAESESDLPERFIRAYLRALEQYNEGATEENVEILSEVFDTEPEVLASYCFPVVRADGFINTDGLMDYQEWALERDLIDEIVAVEELWDPRFVESVAAEMAEMEE